MGKRLAHISFGLLVLTVMVLTAASFLEKTNGTETAHKYIYGSLPFVVIWLLLAVSSLAAVTRAWRKAKQWPMLILHTSMAVILLGAGITFFFGQQGDLYLYYGKAADRFTAADGKQQPMPFSMELRKFDIEYYAGTDSPMDFVSKVRFSDGDEQRVSMNNIAQKQHYRFYQSGYDLENGGVHLSVSHDPVGIAVTYSGYALLLLSILAFLIDPRGGFRRTLRRVAGGRSAKAMAVAVTLLMVAPVKTMSSTDVKLPKTLPAAQAERYGDLYVYHSGRICPMQTLARDFTTKLCGSDTYRGYTAEQVLIGWLLFPADWVEQPMIKVKGSSVRMALNAKGGYVSWIDYIGGEGNFRLAHLVDRMNKGLLSGGEARDVAAAYEKYNIAASLMSGKAIRMFPVRDGGKLRWMAQGDRMPEGIRQDEWLFIKRSTDYVMELALAKDYAGMDNVLEKIREYQQKKAGAALPTASRFRAEKIYNSMQFSLPLAVLLILSGMFFYILVVRNSLRNINTPKIIMRCGRLAMAVSACFLLVAMTLRGYVGGHLPLSNGFETMQLMALCILAIAFPLSIRIPLFMPFGLVAGGLAMTVSMIGEGNPQITTLMPVLASPLLSIHVTITMLSYSLFTLLFFNGVTALSMSRMKSSDEVVGRLTDISRLMLYPAIFLLAIGIFTGAVWANMSWGRYWGWDPKETWALVTMLVYSIALHEKSLPTFRRPAFFNAYVVLAFITVLMTYFGVNFLLGGLHSYA